MHEDVGFPNGVQAVAQVFFIQRIHAFLRALHREAAEGRKPEPADQIVRDDVQPFLGEDRARFADGGQIAFAVGDVGVE